MKNQPVVRILTCIFFCIQLSYAFGESANAYLFSNFEVGKVYFRNGTISNARLNYSYRFGELQYIGNGKDTMLLTNKWLIQYIVVGNHTFYCSEQYGDLKLVSEFQDVKLLKKEYFKPVEHTKDYSERKYTASADQPSSHYISRTAGEFSWQNNIAMPGYRVKTTFFILDKNNQIWRAEKKVILQLFDENKGDVRQYIRNEKVRFDSEQDLEKLLNYCVNLSGSEF